MDCYELLQKRRSIRKFEQTPISKQQLLNYINAARLAPSAANLQSLKYIAVSGGEMKNRLFPYLRWAAYLEDYAPKEDERPAAYILLCNDRSIRQSGYEYDAGASAAHIIMSALSDGVGSCWLRAIDFEGISNLFQLDENTELISVIALGYPKEQPSAVPMSENDVKYFIGEDGALKVPKRSMDEVVIGHF